MMAWADPDRVAEVVDQLLDNALRHCAAGDGVTLVVSRGDHLGELVVRDSGEGFEPAEAERIFERFHRAGHGAGRPEATGSGIGLTIARALTAAQGGTLTASSDGPGRGATFTLRLPAPPQA